MVHYPSTSKRKGRPSLVRALHRFFFHVFDIQLDHLPLLMKKKAMEKARFELAIIQSQV